jgi:hypothetical protein
MPIQLIASSADSGRQFHRDYLDKCMFPLDKTCQTLIVYSCDNKRLPPETETLIRSIDKPLLVHLSDETRIHATDYYKGAGAVIRPYFDARIPGDNIWFVPIGYANGYANDSAALQTTRTLGWVFAGQAKGHRGEMIGHLSSIAPNYMHLTTSWQSADGLSSKEVIDLYRRTVFVPCPFGNKHPDSLRISEALEWGCLPVTIKFMGTDYFKYIFGDHPFIVSNDWAQASSRMRELLDDSLALADLQQRTLVWYQTFKENLIQDLANILEGQTTGLKSPQFAYQREGQANQLLRLKYELHFGQGFMARKYQQALQKLKAYTARYM